VAKSSSFQRLFRIECHHKVWILGHHSRAHGRRRKVLYSGMRMCAAVGQSLPALEQPVQPGHAMDAVSFSFSVEH